MTVVIKDTKVSARDKAMGWAGCPIDTAGLEFAHFFGGTLDNSLRNFSYGKTKSTAVGAPGVNADSVTLLGRSNFLQTAMADTNESTLVVAFKPLDFLGAILAGNLISTNDGTTRKLALTYNDTMNISGFRGTVSNGAGSSVPTPLVVGVPACLALRNAVGATPKTFVNNLSNGEHSEAPNAGTPSLGSAVRVGSGYNSSGYASRTEMYVAIGFSRKITDSELATLYAWIKAYCARRSITL